MHSLRMSDYTNFTRTTAVYPKDRAIDYLVLGLASEAGEVAGKLKKHIRGDGNAIKDEILSETGDVLWYVTRICDEYGITLEELASLNFFKLKSRIERGQIRGNGDNR